MTEAASPVPARTILCIPGHWKDLAELTQAIPATGYLFTDGMMVSIDSGHTFRLEVCEPDARLVDAFRSAGGHWMTDDDEVKIGQHSLVLYLVADGGSHECAKAAMLAAAALLRVGGYAVKVETSGIAHTKEDWLDFCEYLHIYSAHRALVVYVTGEKTYSCGMHNLGLPDAIVDSSDSTDAAELIRTFTWYMFSENPAIRDGETFSVGAGQPVYKLTFKDCHLYEQDDIFFNPFGLVLLKRASH